MARKWQALFTLLLAGVIIWFWQKEKTSKPRNATLQIPVLAVKEPLWIAPDSNTIPRNDSGYLIRYGKKLIGSTSKYFGPRGSLGHYSNGMNCQNCHLEAGTKIWAGNFGSVASLYPRFSDRRGTTETINQRITDCFERSMNGKAPDSNSREMKAMNAYIRWVGKDVKKGKKPPGTGLELLAYIDRPADPEKGRQIYIQKCQLCHGANGEGKSDSLAGYLYPPLWGEHSYNQFGGIVPANEVCRFCQR